MTSFQRFKTDQEDRVEREKRAPLNLTYEQWRHEKQVPGSIWLGALGGAYGPPGSAVLPDKRSGEA